MAFAAFVTSRAVSSFTLIPRVLAGTPIIVFWFRRHLAPRGWVPSIQPRLRPSPSWKVSVATAVSYRAGIRQPGTAQPVDRVLPTDIGRLPIDLPRRISEARVAQFVLADAVGHHIRALASLSRYQATVSAIPRARVTSGSQPVERSKLTSSSFRGVPSGFVVSQ